MAQTIDKIVKSKYPPKDKNVMWVDTSSNPPVQKVWDGTWKPMEVNENVDYENNVVNKPTINGVEVTGNLTNDDLKLRSNTAFKGWFDDTTALNAKYPEPLIGDFAYVHDASPATTVSIYRCATAGTWADSGDDVDTSLVQTFASGQSLNQVHIVKDFSGGDDDVANAESVKELFEYALGGLITINGSTLGVLEDGAISANHDLSTNANYQRRIIPNDGYVYISGVASSYSNIVIVGFYNGTPAANTFISGVEATTSYVDQSYGVQVPNGTVYIVVVNYKTASTSPATIYLKKYGDRIGDLEDRVDVIDSELYLNNISVASVDDGYVLAKSDGTKASSQYTSDRGVSGFIPTNGVTQLTIISGVIQGANTNYCPVCFYSSDNESSFVEYYQPSSSGELLNVTIDIPPTANYARFTLFDKSVPAIIKLQSRLDCLDESVQDINNKIQVYYQQIHNNYLPRKANTEELNILMIGSSWGIDTIAALADICNNVGLSVNTGDLYKSGGTIAQYLDDIDNGGTNTFFYNHGGTNENLGNKTVLQALQYKDWDIIIVMNSAADSVVMVDGLNYDFAKWLRYLKKNCTNSRCVFAINATWTKKDEQYLQSQAYTVISALMKQSGIDVVLPIGTAMVNLRNTSVNNGNDIYRDYIHLDRGVGRFTASATVFYQLVYPVFGVGLDNCSLTGTWEQGTSGTHTYTDIAVSSENRATCIDCAKEAVCNQFGFDLT